MQTRGFRQVYQICPRRSSIIVFTLIHFDMNGDGDVDNDRDNDSDVDNDGDNNSDGDNRVW